MTRLFSNPWRLTVIPFLVLLLFTTLMITAQRSIRASYVLQVDVSNPSLSHLCIGQTTRLPVTVALRTVEFLGDGSVGSLTVRSAVVTAVVANPSILTAEQSGSPSSPTPGAPFQTYLDLTGEEMGSTTITINATVNSSINRTLDEEVTLPIPITDPADPVSVAVRVVPCDYQVKVGSLWVTTLFSANVLVSAISDPVRLRSVTGGSFGASQNAFYVLMVMTNRLPACIGAEVNTFIGQPLRVEGQILDDALYVTIEYLLPPYSRYELDCHRNYDLGESPLSQLQHQQNFNPERLEVSVPLGGGTVTSEHRVNFSLGSAVGRATITITPIRPR